MDALGFFYWDMIMKEQILHRVVTFLDRKELDFLDSITKDILFSKGIKVPRSTILKHIIDIFLISQDQEIGDHQTLIEVLTQRIKKERNK